MKMIKYYLAISLLFLVAAAVTGVWWISLISAWTGFSVLCVALAYILNKPGIFRKRNDGTIPTAIRWVFWPFLFGTGLYNWFARKYDRVPAVQKVTDEVYLACRLFPDDIESLRSNGVTAILDVTAEFDGLDWSSQDANLAYLNIPVLDHTAPNVDQLSEAIKWIAKQLHGDGKVVIHCALGRGRSVLVTAAFLLSQDDSLTVLDAMNKIQTARETARLNKHQRKSLEKIRAEGHLYIREKLAMVVNPVSGGGKWDKEKLFIIETLSSRYELDIRETTPDLSAKKIAEKFQQEGFKLIIACGGDGTLAEVAHVLAESECTMGIIPLGTANALSMVLFGNSSKFSPISSACNIILSGHAELVDTAMCNGLRTLLICGIGVESKMIQRSDRGQKDDKGQLAYLQYFMSSLIDSETHVLDVQLDDGSYQSIDTKSLIVANSAPPSTVLAQGGGNPNIQDGLLDVNWFSGDQTLLKNLSSVAGLTMSGVFDEKYSDAVVFKRCKKITIKSSEPLDFVLDGEVHNAGTITVESRPQSLRVLCDPNALSS